MATDLTVVLDNHPGALADVGEALGKAGINVDGLCAVTEGDKGTVHILVDDAAAASSVIAAFGTISGNGSPVFVLDVENKPGELGALSRKLADASVNIEFAYVASNNRLVLAVDDMEKAKAVL